MNKKFSIKSLRGFEMMLVFILILICFSISAPNFLKTSNFAVFGIMKTERSGT